MQKTVLIVEDDDEIGRLLGDPAAADSKEVRRKFEPETLTCRKTIESV